jgi:hypothetical protein
VRSTQKTLVSAALILVAIGVTLGLVYAATERYETFPVLQHRAFWAAASTAGQDGSDDLSHSLQHDVYTYVRIIDAHTHLIKIGTVVLLIALVYPLISLPEGRKRSLGWMLVAGNCIFPLGVLGEIYIPGRLPQAIAAAGALLVIVSFAAMFYGLLRRAANSEVASQRPSHTEP